MTRVRAPSCASPCPKNTECAFTDRTRGARRVDETMCDDKMEFEFNPLRLSGMRHTSTHDTSWEARNADDARRCRRRSRRRSPRGSGSGTVRRFAVVEGNRRCFRCIR